MYKMKYISWGSQFMQAHKKVCDENKKEKRKTRKQHPHEQVDVLPSKSKAPCTQVKLYAVNLLLLREYNDIMRTCLPTHTYSFIFSSPHSMKLFNPFTAITAIWQFEVITRMTIHITSVDKYPYMFQYSIRLFYVKPPHHCALHICYVIL